MAWNRLPGRSGGSGPVSTAPANSPVGGASAHDDATSSRPLVSRGRTMTVHASLVLFALAILAQTVQIQLVDRGKWATAGLRQHVKRQTVAPMRGRILDANGSVLVESRELVRLEISPKAIDSTKRYGDARRVIRQGLTAIGVRESLIRRALDTAKGAVVIPALYAPSDVDQLVLLKAVRQTRELRRFMSAPLGIQRILGTMSDGQEPQGGVELELDPLLRGISGSDELIKDGRGNRLESPALARVSARPGHTVTLTLNRSLQEIAERELALAMDRTGASGGDVVLLDPQDGSVLALAGARDGVAAANSTPLTDPYEPGSVMKPFTVARLLDLKRATPDEMVNTEGGKWLVAGRTITDEHPHPSMPVRDVIRLSSNIGVAKLAQRLSPREAFEALRDFGFGTFTGVPYPAESRGRLPSPARAFGTAGGWGPQTSSAVAMGYEVSATPLQIAAAYATLANGGEVVQPVLIREIHDADGTLVFKHQRRVVRRAISEETARSMRTMLESVVDSGTATAAGLETYDVAGKSGTAKRAGPHGYIPGAYNATFAALFPSQAPQYVIVAKLIDPRSKIFGGVVSGDLVHGILQAALATRENSLDRRELAKYAKPLRMPVDKPRSPQSIAAATRDSMHFDSLRAPVPAAAPAVAAAGRVVIALPFVAAGATTDTPPTATTPTNGTDSAVAGGPSSSAAATRIVPSVFGLDIRQAARTLFAAGFQVRIAKGVAGQTRPAAGALLGAGSVVVLFSAP